MIGRKNQTEARDGLLDFLEECRCELSHMSESTTQRRYETRGCTVDCGGDVRRLPVRHHPRCSFDEEALEPVAEREEEVEEEPAPRVGDDVACEKKFSGEIVKIRCNSRREWISRAGRGQRQVRGCNDSLRRRRAAVCCERRCATAG